MDETILIPKINLIRHGLEPITLGLERVNIVFDVDSILEHCTMPGSITKVTKASLSPLLSWLVKLSGRLVGSCSKVWLGS